VIHKNRTLLANPALPIRGSLSSCDRIPLSGILEKSVMLRLCVGLTIFTDNEINDRAEDKFQPGHFKESVSVKVSSQIKYSPILIPNIFLCA
jgi:hypothetical protein